MNKKWSKETVFEESKKYSSKTEFKKNRGGAFKVAYDNGWLVEMDWLKHPTPKSIKWTYDAVIKESKKYPSIIEFNKNKIHQAIKMFPELHNFYNLVLQKYRYEIYLFIMKKAFYNLC